MSFIVYYLIYNSLIILSFFQYYRIFMLNNYAISKCKKTKYIVTLPTFITPQPIPLIKLCENSRVRGARSKYDKL
jgi:hypothetical protein